MHKFERFGRTSDRGTPIHPYRTTHITHTHGDFLGSTSLPRLFSHSYGLPGLRLIVFLFPSSPSISRSSSFNIYQSCGNGSSRDQLRAGLDWMDRYIYQDFAIRPGFSSHVVRRFTHLVSCGLGPVQRCLYCLPRLPFSRLPTLSGILRSF
jgi:hypothetical protein